VIERWFGNERRAGASEGGDGEGQRKVRGEETEQNEEGLRIWCDERKGRAHVPDARANPPVESIIGAESSADAQS
jgi:hypothetical protein